MLARNGSGHCDRQKDVEADHVQHGLRGTGSRCGSSHAFLAASMPDLTQQHVSIWLMPPFHSGGMAFENTEMIDGPIPSRDCRASSARKASARVLPEGIDEVAH